MFNNAYEWKNATILFALTANLGYCLTNCWQFQKIKILNLKNSNPLMTCMIMLDLFSLP